MENFTFVEKFCYAIFSNSLINDNIAPTEPLRNSFNTLQRILANEKQDATNKTNIHIAL